MNAYDAAGEAFYGEYWPTARRAIIALLLFGLTVFGFSVGVLVGPI